MATGGKIGYGLEFKVGDGATPEVFTKLAEVNSVTDVSSSADVVEATNMDSPDGHKEYILGLKDGGEVNVNVNYLPGNATHENLLDDYTNGTRRNFQAIPPGSPVKTWTFTGLVVGYNPNVPLEDKMTAEYRIKITGAPTYK